MPFYREIVWCYWMYSFAFNTTMQQENGNLDLSIQLSKCAIHQHQHHLVVVSLKKMQCWLWSTGVTLQRERLCSRRPSAHADRWPLCVIHNHWNISHRTWHYKTIFQKIANLTGTCLVQTEIAYHQILDRHSWCSQDECYWCFVMTYVNNY